MQDTQDIDVALIDRKNQRRMGQDANDADTPAGIPKRSAFRVPPHHEASLCGLGPCRDSGAQSRRTPCASARTPAHACPAWRYRAGRSIAASFGGFWLALVALGAFVH